METKMVHTLTATFEAHAQQTDNEVEFWLARDLQHLLGYAEWRNFTTVISKAKTACEVSEHAIRDHFVDVNKMVDIGNGGFCQFRRRINSKEELRRLFQFSDQFHADELPTKAGIDKLDKLRLWQRGFCPTTDLGQGLSEHWKNGLI
jgi:hypothetical protein